MTEWRKAGESPRPMMAMAAAEVQPLAQVVGDIPDVHVITVAERRVSVDYSTIIQNNMNTDTIDLVLDGEWDGMSVVCYIGHPGDLGEFEWEGTPFTLPVYDTTGSIDVTVVGLSADGKTRLVTVEAKGVMNVIKSGEFEGSVPPEDQPDLLGQILAAKEEAEDATNAANSAAESANSAVERFKTEVGDLTTAVSQAQTAQSEAAASASAASASASQAQQSATAAAESAASVADKYISSAQATTLEPGSQATASVENQVLTIGVPKGDKGDPGTGVPDGGTPGQLLSKTDSGTAWVDPPSTGNVLKRTVSDLVAHGEDAYAQKPIEVRVKGKTVQNLWVNPSGTSKGITVAPNSDGSINISGSARGTSITRITAYTLKPNETYTASVDKAGPSNFLWIELYDSSDSLLQRIQFGNLGTNKKTFTVPSNCASSRMCVAIASGDTVSGTYRVMLNEGSEAEPWCPPGLNSVGDDGSVEIVTAGKNLLNEDAPTVDGIIGPQLPPGEYVLSGTLPSGASLRLLNGGADGETITDASSLPHSFTAGYPFTPYYAGVGGYATGLMLELGSTATDYEPPNITTTTIDLQGHTLNSLPDGTRDELYIDGGGNVVLEKRCGVATAPTSEGSWFWETAGDGIASFTLLAKSTGTQTDMTELMRCDKLPVRKVTGEASYAIVGNTQGHAKNPAITSTATAATVAGGATYLYCLAEPQTIDLGTITPPTMAAPNVTAYVVDDTPAEMTLDYVRDVNIVHSRLEERVAALELASATS